MDIELSLRDDKFEHLKGNTLKARVVNKQGRERGGQNQRGISYSTMAPRVDIFGRVCALRDRIELK